MNRTSVTILGATGSIGRSTADVLLQHRDSIETVAVVGGRDPVALASVARELGAKVAAIADPSELQALREALAGSGIEAAAGPAAIAEAASRPADWTMAAIAGTAGLQPTVAAARRGGRIALATKECLVCAGKAFLAEVEKGGAVLVPVDSEHNAVQQLLAAGRRADLDRVTLTASGGPFRQWSAAQMRSARPADALKHPTWSMGAKISIDSATLMNKGLELVEAQLMFGLEPDQLEALVHPESVIHGLVTFRDGSVIAHLAPPDMRVPIAYALGWPDERMASGAVPLDLAARGKLTFERADEERFPALSIAKAAMRHGGAVATVMNAANEVAVAAFLAEEIGFLDIVRLVVDAIEKAESSGLVAAPPGSIEQAVEIDAEGRKIARRLLPALAARTH